MKGAVFATCGEKHRSSCRGSYVAVMALHQQSNEASPIELNPLYSQQAEESHAPRNALPLHELDPDVAYQLVRDELMLDGNSRLNLATFVTTWMEPQAQKLMAETFDKNMIDKDEYPRTAEIERRCVNMLSRLWNSPAEETATGTSTTGSSEAAMLGGMALKWRWRDRQQAAGKPTDAPNLVMGSNVQVCWEKFCRYWEVEPRLVPMEGDRYHLDAPNAVKHCDENTIGVIPVLGSTFDGSYEPVAAICAALDKLQADTGVDVPVHVDGASGGFIAPFLDPDVVWDFRLPRVQSINTSGHKYGLVYPGVGWVIWRNPDALPQELVFDVNYLGGDMPTFALNFSRPGNQIAAQYYNFLRLGFEGYRRVQQASRDVARFLADSIGAMDHFELITDGSELPVFAFTLNSGIDNYTVFDISERLRDRGWLVPAYTFPENRQDLSALRVVVRNGFSRDLADLLVSDLQRHTQYFDQLTSPLPGAGGRSFSH
jgi:glutamate decarboxylase